LRNLDLLQVNQNGVLLRQKKLCCHLSLITSQRQNNIFKKFKAVFTIFSTGKVIGRNVLTKMQFICFKSAHILTPSSAL
jgi:hypothetical protein